ncbi:MAG: peptidase M1, partial [Bryobacteraceae bacterium]
MVQGEPTRVSSQGFNTELYLRESRDMAQAYGDEAGKVMTHLSTLFGAPPHASLAVVETEAGTPNGYAAPGIVFLSPKAIGKQVNPRLLANQLSRQWFGVMISPATRNHAWIQNGAARYSELLYLEHLNGPGALESEVRDSYIEALTLENIPVIQDARL